MIEYILGALQVVGLVYLELLRRRQRLCGDAACLANLGRFLRARKLVPDDTGGPASGVQKE